MTRRIIRRMRRWFILVLVALLPLRGWVGDAMAGQMLAQHLAATKTVASTPVSMGGGEHSDCMGHAASPAAPAADEAVVADAPAGADCPTCAQCQACSSFALALPPAIALPPLAQAVVPGEAAARFASADPLPGLKPPIS